MPRMITFMLTHFADGAVLGLGCAELILCTGVGHLRRLFAASGHDAALTALFFLQSAITCGTLAVAVALLALPARKP